MDADNDKPWDARLVDWMSNGSDTATGKTKPRDLRVSLVAGVAGGITGGQLADGRWWYFAGLLVAALFYRLVRTVLDHNRR